MTEWVSRLKGKMTKENMAVAALLGLLCMVIAIPTDRREEKEKEQKGSWGEAGDEASQQQYGEGEAGSLEPGQQQYARWLEERLETFLTAMDGVGRVKVMVTMSSSGEQVVEKDVPSATENVEETDSAGGTRQSLTSSQEESTVYVTASSGEKTPYVTKTLEPEVEGVTVAAQGGGNGVIQKNITEVIQALFDIEPHKIKVVKMK